MSAVIAAPELIETAATDMAAIGSTVNAAHLTAAAPTVAVLPAAADEVSASVAHLFSQHAADYQALAGRAAAFQEQFVQHLNASAGSFARAEAANVSSLRALTASAGSYPAANGNYDLLQGAFPRIYADLHLLPYPLGVALWFIFRNIVVLSFFAFIVAFGVLIYIANSLGLWGVM